MRSRVITVILAVAAAVAFALAVQSPWWSIGEVDIGPFGTHRCFGGECRASGLAWIEGSELWARSALATRVAGYIAMFVLLMFAGARAAKREPRLVARASLSAIITAAVAGGYFATAFPGVTGASLGPGLWFFAGAIIAGAAAVIVFLRTVPPAPR